MSVGPEPARLPGALSGVAAARADHPAAAGSAGEDAGQHRDGPAGRANPGAAAAAAARGLLRLELGVEGLLADLGCVPEILRDDPQIGQGHPHDLVRRPQAGDPRLAGALARRGRTAAQADHLGLVLQPLPDVGAELELGVEDAGPAGPGAVNRVLAPDAA